MNLFSSRTSILTLAHLSSIDLSFSFITDHRRHTVGNVNAANTGDLLLPATTISFPKYKSKIFFNNGGYDDKNDNLLPFDDDKNLECTSFLRRVSSAFRGGGGISGGDYVSNSSGALSALSVAELKRLLIDRGVDYRDCLEKKDLVDRLISSRGMAPAASNSFAFSSSGNDSYGNGLSSEENRVVNTFKKASPAVAYIQTSSQQQVIQRGFSLKGTEVPIGAGSGFLWDDKGHIVTNYHVIASATKTNNPVIKVKLQGMEAQTATIVGYEPEKDLAVLKISTKNLPTPVPLGSSSDLQVGQSVLALGNPFGLDYN